MVEEKQTYTILAMIAKLSNVFKARDDSAHVIVAGNESSSETSRSTRLAWSDLLLASCQSEINSSALESMPKAGCISAVQVETETQVTAHTAHARKGAHQGPFEPRSSVKDHVASPGEHTVRQRALQKSSDGF
jgi:hypothetical protein